LVSSSSRSIKGNFDVAIRGSLAVAAAVISDDSGNIISAATMKLYSLDALQGEALAALLTTRLAVTTGSSILHLEGDALLVVLAINKPALFSSWSFVNCISDISLELSSFHSWSALKVSRCANYRAHALAQWAATNLVFGSIPIGSPFSRLFRSRVGKILPVTFFPHSIRKKKKKKNF
jgi:hypothetical protein